MEVNVSEFAKNYVFLETDRAGFVRFHRFTPRQLPLYADDSLHRFMAACSSGVEISFSTPGDVVSFECRRDFHLKVFLDGLWKLVKSKLTRDEDFVKPVDGFDLLVDGELKGFLPPKNGRLEFEFSNEGESPVDVRSSFLPFRASRSEASRSTAPSRDRRGRKSGSCAWGTRSRRE